MVMSREILYLPLACPGIGFVYTNEVEAPVKKHERGDGMLEEGFKKPRLLHNEPLSLLSLPRVDSDSNMGAIF